MYLNRKNNIIILDSGPIIPYYSIFGGCFYYNGDSYTKIYSGMSQYHVFTYDHHCAYKHNKYYKMDHGGLYKNSDLITFLNGKITKMCAITEDILEIHIDNYIEILNFRENNKIKLTMFFEDDQCLWLDEIRFFKKKITDNIITFDDNIIINNKIYNKWSYANCREFNYDDFMFLNVLVQPRASFCLIYHILRKIYKIPKPLVVIIIEIGWIIPYE